jgi:hypothetical protein
MTISTMRSAVFVALVVASLPGAALAQTPSPAPAPPAPPTSPAAPIPAAAPVPKVMSHLWIVIGPGYTTARAGCPSCDPDGIYAKSASLLLDAGMGIGIVGNGLFSPLGPQLAPPYTTNALGIVYGVGWEFAKHRRWNLQAHAMHHVAALGELTTVSGESIKNVVGNYWTVGVAFVIR